MAGILHLLPAGTPFAMTWRRGVGHKRVKHCHVVLSMARCADTVAGAAGFEATLQRRSQEWQQQLNLATEEMNQLTKQVLGAQIRLSIAQKTSTSITQIEQAQEVHDFLKTRFTNVDLYTFISSQLMRLYREAYQMAAQVARQAERGYQFERDSTELFIQGDNWQSTRSVARRRTPAPPIESDGEGVSRDQHARHRSQSSRSRSCRLLRRRCKT
jgi:hypothetical protein